MPTIQSYEEAVDYIYGTGSVHWTIEPRDEGGPRWIFTYCDNEGNPRELHGTLSDTWHATLDDLNISVSHLKPNIGDTVREELTPVIRKIRKLEARFKERVSG